MPRIVIVLDNVRSAFNVGAIFRTADGLQADIHLIGITPLPGKDAKLEKTSLQSLEYVDWKYFDTAQDWFKFITLAKQERTDINLIMSAEEAKDLKSYSLFNLSRSELLLKEYKHIYIVFGHEINGVSEYLLQKSDMVVTIPMHGKKNSLNISTCVGIIGYRVKEIITAMDHTISQ